jgi:hypothetical protein
VCFKERRQSFSFSKVVSGIYIEKRIYWLRRPSRHSDWIAPSPELDFANARQESVPKLFSQADRPQSRDWVTLLS